MLWSLIAPAHAPNATENVIFCFDGDLKVEGGKVISGIDYRYNNTVF